ncbi:MAG: phosphoethanolamine--lipid A transferase [Gammaproteobacteria bacterium]
MAWRRPTFGVEALLLLASLTFATAYNHALWTLLFGTADVTKPHTAALFAALFLVVVCVQFAGLALLATRHTVKPLLILLFLCTALASFYMDRYSVFLNTEMLRNILRTDVAEARELVTAPLLFHLLLYAALPIILVLAVRVRVRPLSRAIFLRAGSVTVALLVAVLAVFLQYRDASSLLRGHRDARHLVTPTNYLASLFKLARETATSGEPEVIGLDAHRALQASSAARRPDLIVLVIGETVRSANFGLSGYERQTTPELSGLDLLVYPRVQACGTSTEVSLPCMFAPVGRRDYNERRIRGQQSLLHVIQRAGIDVTWIDNQSGCKGVCAGLREERIGGNSDPALCDGDRCLDAILLPRLAAAVDASTGDLVVVLHMLGNHGPAYSRRYPPEFRKFSPTCESEELDACSPQEIINAYDNAVLYTDHVLAGLVHYLGAQTGRNAGLIYVSDHGESLGESGVYLHGLPYRIAPATQREVPMVVWLSGNLEQSLGLNPACLQEGTHGEVAHDHLFHSVLGLLRVETTLHEPDLDLFSRCRQVVGAPTTAGDDA